MLISLDPDEFVFRLVLNVRPRSLPNTFFFQKLVHGVNVWSHAAVLVPGLCHGADYFVDFLKRCGCSEGTEEF